MRCWIREQKFKLRNASRARANSETELEQEEGNAAKGFKFNVNRAGIALPFVQSQARYFAAIGSGRRDDM